MTDHVQALAAELGRFIAGEADTEQLKTAFRAYVSQHPGERDAVAAWVDGRVRNGRLPADIRCRDAGRSWRGQAFRDSPE
jgi:hypothetical protein